jgi:hypothetical protein
MGGQRRWDRLKIAASAFDLAKHSRFETPQIVEADALAIATLVESVRPDGQVLAERLRSCASGESRPCGSPACRIDMRPLRRAVTSATCLLAKTTAEHTGFPGVIASIVLTKMQFRVGELHRFDLRKARRRLWNALSNAEFFLPIVATFDYGVRHVERQEADSVWQVTSNVACFGMDAGESSRRSFRDRLKRVLDLEEMVERPLKITPLKEPMNQLSYTLKSYYERAVSYADVRQPGTTFARPMQNTSDWALRPHQLRELALHLDRFNIGDRMFLVNARWKGSEIVWKPRVKAERL